jgi:hypothetical protein
MKPIHRRAASVAAALALLALAGCGDVPGGWLHGRAAAESRILRERAELEAREAVGRRQLELTEQRLRREEELRERAERGTALWRSGSALLVVLSGVTLFLGAAAGSATRKEVAP